MKFAFPLSLALSLAACTGTVGEVQEERSGPGGGLRAYRRPLSAEESKRFDDQFQSTLASYDFGTAVEWTVYTMLQSPNFLFRVESGGVASNTPYVKPSGYEMASRLSYLLWQSMPSSSSPV